MDKYEESILLLSKEDQMDIGFFLSKNISKEEWVKRSTKRLRLFIDLVNRNGFPYLDKVGQDIYKAGIALALHLDVDIMRRFFETYIDSQPGTRILPGDKAFFVDKIRVLSDEPQLYGTQYRVIDGKINSLPIEDEAAVDERRKGVGLEPLQKYLEKVAKKRDSSKEAQTVEKL